MRLITCISILILHIISCTSAPNTCAKEDAALKKEFTNEEITSLNLIVNYFDSHVLKIISSSDTNEAYHSYFESLISSNSYESLNAKVGLNQSEVNNLLKNLEAKGVFDEIWNYEYGYDYETKDTLSIVLVPNLNGRYWKFFEIISQDDSYLNEYKSRVDESRNIPPSIITGFQNIHNKFDFNKEVNRLIWAVHFITAFSMHDIEK